MRRASHFALSAATAALLATSVAGPADARRYRHWDHDRLDAGDLIIGAVIIGGIAAIASEISRSRDNNGTVYGRDRDRKRNGSSEGVAVDACADAAERRASDSGRDARVNVITGIERQGDSYRVRGTLEYRSGGRDSADDRQWQDTARFTCSYSYGRVDYVHIDDAYAYSWQ